MNHISLRQMGHLAALLAVFAVASCGVGSNDEPTAVASTATAGARAVALATTAQPLVLLPSMLSHDGLTDFIPEGIVDGDAATYGWQTDQSRVAMAAPDGPFGAWLQIDLGRRQALTRLGIHAMYAAPRKEYMAVYSDDLVNWQSGGVIQLSASGWNYSSGSALAASGAHRYWRLILLGSPGPGPWLSELAIWSDGRSYARETVTAEMLGQNGLSAYIPSGMVDGDTGTYGWHTDTAVAGAWLGVDFGVPRSVAQINVHRVLDTIYWSLAQYGIKASDDGVTWQASDIGMLPTHAVGWNAVAPDDARPHRYWRLQLQNTPRPAAWMSELEFLTVDRAPRQLSLSSSMLSQSGLTGYEPAGIVDADAGTRGWHTDNATEGAWLQLDLGAPQSVAGIGVFRLQDNMGRHLARYQPQWSDDGQDWASIGIVLQPLQVGWNRVPVPDHRAHRYWRLLLTNTPGPAAWISELELTSFH